MRVASEEMAILGEGPLWHTGEHAVYWVDILGHKVFRLEPESGETVTILDDRMVTALAENRDGGLTLVADDVLLALDEAGITEIARTGTSDLVRTNDGKAGPDGRLWFGSMDWEAVKPLGSLMVYDGEVKTVFDGITISNGLGWSPSGDVFYHTDTIPGLIYQHRYDLTSGRATDRRVLVDLTDVGAGPDGLAVDADGNLWVAMWDGWSLLVFDATGRKIDELTLPVQRPTSVAFGGPDLADLYITSATDGLAPEDLETQPDAGKLLVTDVGAKGSPVGLIAVG
ncbi:MAG TPA: SMP-30/gluconolactonase/LRE family protein [Acidimicrobiia bacterium]|nr:SMP-30/gluconolactonase/LRE family protein [Acidimicrobiia bacterium]